MVFDLKKRQTEDHLLCNDLSQVKHTSLVFCHMSSNLMHGKLLHIEFEIKFEFEFEIEFEMKWNEMNWNEMNLKLKIENWIKFESEVENWKNILK